jgi:hypothetical protein
VIASFRSHIATGLSFDGQGKEFVVYVHYRPEECLRSPAFEISLFPLLFTLYGFLFPLLDILFSLSSSLGGDIFRGGYSPRDKKDMVGWEGAGDV